MHDLDALGSLVPDDTVRRARPEDAPAIAAIQRAAWRQDYPPELAARLAALDPEQVTQSWLAAISGPPSPQHVVLVALGSRQVVGFAAVTPVDIVALEVHPDFRGAGHGSRLLNAAVDEVREHGSATIGTWILASDDARARFLSAAGLQPDGRQRRLSDEDGSDEVVEVRYAATL